MSFPQLLREFGMPRMQSKIAEVIEQKISTNLAEDRFYSEAIEIPELTARRPLRAFRNGDFVALLSLVENVQKLALWFLVTRCKLWEIEIDPDYYRFYLSPRGMILISSGSGSNIIVDGKISGTIPKLQWRSINAIGLNILGCWAERVDIPGDELRIVVSLGEWDHLGNLLRRNTLKLVSPGSHFIYAFDENYCVVLSGRTQVNQISNIVVVDRIVGTMKTFMMPSNSCKEKFTDACIVQNRLFYIKNVIRENTPWARIICIFNLVDGTIIGEFPTGQTGALQNLVANQNYAAWVDFQGITNTVTYLDISTKTIIKSAFIHYRSEMNVDLKMFGSILSITYSTRNWSATHQCMLECWRRKVVDMKNGELKRDISYKNGGEFSFSNGNIFMIDYFSSPPRMYIESFLSSGPSKEGSSLRIGSHLQDE